MLRLCPFVSCCLSSVFSAAHEKYCLSKLMTKHFNFIANLTLKTRISSCESRSFGRRIHQRKRQKQDGPCKCSHTSIDTLRYPPVVPVTAGFGGWLAAKSLARQAYIAQSVFHARAFYYSPTSSGLFACLYTDYLLESIIPPPSIGPSRPRCIRGTACPPLGPPAYHRLAGAEVDRRRDEHSRLSESAGTANA